MNWFSLKIVYKDGTEELASLPPHEFFRRLQSIGAKGDTRIEVMEVIRIPNGFASYPVREESTSR